MPAEGVIVDACDAGQVPWPAFCLPAPSARNRVPPLDRATLARRLRLYVITDNRAARGRSMVEIAAAALAGGATALQLRDKTSSALEQVALGRELRRLTRAAGALFLVNDRVDI